MKNEDCRPVSLVGWVRLMGLWLNKSVLYTILVVSSPNSLNPISNPPNLNIPFLRIFFYIAIFLLLYFPLSLSLSLSIFCVNKNWISNLLFNCQRFYQLLSLEIIFSDFFFIYFNYKTKVFKKKDNIILYKSENYFLMKIQRHKKKTKNYA